jgi:crotonobetainyl-CoA:carnitine CoA-transferase CaiB-like acyl-CoA transferase
VLCLLYDAWWPDFASTVGHTEWLDDPRFATPAARAEHNVALIAALDAVFASRTLAEWEDAFLELEGVWSPVKSPAEVIEDEQALVNGFVTPVAFRDGGGEYYTGPSPAQFDERPIGALQAAPAYGADTDEVLGEAGLPAERIKDLRAAGVIS